MNRLGRAYEAIVFGSAMLGMAALAACSGQTFTVGNNGSAVEAISPSAAATGGPSCDTGSSHPNVCCDPTGTSCEVFTTPSLEHCPADHPVTRPDGRYCCPLDPAGACLPSSGPTAITGAGSSCMYACKPGYAIVSTLSYPETNECCNATGSDCYTVTTPNCSEPICNCPAQTTASSNCTCAPSSCAPPSAPSCDACPSGWQAPTGDPAGDPALCCRNDPAMPSVIDCFTQAVPLPPPVDAGTGPIPCVENGVSHAEGTSWTCADGCNTCTCNNGQVGGTLIACLVDAAPPPAIDAGPPPCVESGVSHANGTAWVCSDGCNRCYCTNGQLLQTAVACLVDAAPPPPIDAAPPPPLDAGECSVASDCKGALPALCEVCTNGSAASGCAHFTCNAGVCVIAYCN